MSLPTAAASVCGWGCIEPWSEIFYSPQWATLEPAVTERDPAIAEQQKAHLELLPLRKVLVNLAAKYGLTHQGEPATWAMQIVLDTLSWRSRHPTSEPNRRWIYDANFSQLYPARTEEGWISVATRLPEEELFNIEIVVPPKQPEESFTAFAKRFNKTCRTVRDRYIQGLKADEWKLPPPKQDFTWIDRLAQWQAGRSASQIDPSVKEPSQRAAFSQGLLKRAGQQIRICPPRFKNTIRNRRPGH